MSEIPEDVRNAAREVWLAIRRPELTGVLPTDAIARAILAERERCAKVCEAEKAAFLSPEYACNQPIGSITERFACDECAAAIRRGST